MDHITQVSIIHHIALVLLLLWILAWLGWSHYVVYFFSLLYLYKVNERYSLRLRKRLQFEERKYASQRRLLSNSESVRWLNHAIEKIWPICMEQIASQQFLLPIIPWFLDKYKPWTAKKAIVQHLYLGRNPPMFNEIRVLGESADDDHLVLELGMSFVTAHDMSAKLEVQLRKRIGLGMRANLHVTGMHVEGKILVGVKFLRQWPFLGRVRVCFVEPPYFQMTVKPIFNHGVDVTELPVIAGWLDNILAVAFEQTLVEPNMLVVDVEKFVSAPKENWFTVDEKPPIAFVKLEIVEAADMKSSDMNGLADPYVKGLLGPYRFRTKVQKKTLAPKWLEEFRIPICSWEAPNVLFFEVRDKDHIFDDMLGDCSINIGDMRGGQRHDKWLTLQNIKKGRLHLAITVLEDEHDKERGHLREDEELSELTDTASHSPGWATQNFSNDDASSKGGKKTADEFEPINIEGQQKTGLWVHHPGSEVSKTWEPRKGRVRRPETQLHREDSDSTQLHREDIDSTDSPRSVSSVSNWSDTNSNNEGVDVNKIHRRSIVRGIHKIGSMFHRSSKNESPRQHREQIIQTPRPNLRAVGEKGIEVKLIVNDSIVENIGDQNADQLRCSLQKGEKECPGKGHVKGMTNMQGGSSTPKYKTLLSREKSDKLEGQVSDGAVMESRSGSDSFNKTSGN